MYYNILTQHMDWHVARRILTLREQYIAEGGDPCTFQQYLETCHGIKVIGPVIKIDEKFAITAKLTES